MGGAPVVSVIVPFRDRIAWLAEAVESVRSQTFGDFEIILVDDGSVERPAFLDAVGDGRIRRIRLERSGAAAARNAGIRAASGTYVAFLDSDDLFLPRKLEAQVETMERRPDVVLSHTSYMRMDAAGNDLEEIRSGAFGGRVYPGIVTCCPIATPTVMARRAIFRDARFEESVDVGEDVILWVGIARDHEILGIDECLTKVRIHGGNAILDPDRQFRGNRNILRNAFRNDRSFPAEFRRNALSRICLTAAQEYLGRGKKRQALGYFLRGLAHRPLDGETWYLMAHAFVPEPLKPAIRKIRGGKR